jgi:hypothetical protein
VKELAYGGFDRITKEVWAKAEDHVLKIEKEYGKENCIDRSERRLAILSVLKKERGFLNLICSYNCFLVSRG